MINLRIRRARSSQCNVMTFEDVKQIYVLDPNILDMRLKNHTQSKIQKT